MLVSYPFTTALGSALLDLAGTSFRGLRARRRASGSRTCLLVRRGAICLLLAASLASCDSGSDSSGGAAGQGASSSATLDAAGGECDSEIASGIYATFQGNGGAGGLVSVITAGTGTILVTDESYPSTPQVPVFDEGSIHLDVSPGQEVKVSGSIQVAWLRVSQGGSLVLTGNTFIVVFGDVEIAGTVRSQRDEHQTNAHDFTLYADGIVNITGRIDCSGFSQDEDDIAAVDRTGVPGGNGGEIYISAIPLVGDARSPRLYVGPRARVLSEGGASHSEQGGGARAGRGGQILMGCIEELVVEGRVSARGGDSVVALPGGEGDGGQIELVASGDIGLYRVSQLNANGGSSTGALAGAGGTLYFETASGILDVQNVALDCRGGTASYFATSVGGEGGTVTLMGGSVLLSNVSANAEGGRANSPDDVATDNRDTGGAGGNGGTVQIKGVTSLFLGQDPLPPAPPPALEPLRPVELLANGGRTALEGFEGGEGGQIKLILTNGPADLFTFGGAATVEGGPAPLGLYGAEGRVCASGASLEAEIAIIGSNNFPIARCTTQDITDFAMGADLACDNTPGQPSSISTETPVVIGVNFFRVYITDAMRVGTPEVPATPFATVSTQGAIDGELYLYVGPAAAFGSYDTAAYTLGSDQSSGPTKSVCYDTTGNVDDFVSVMVVEQTPFVEAFTITVQCSESPCSP